MKSLLAAWLAVIASTTSALAQEAEEVGIDGVISDVVVTD